MKQFIYFSPFSGNSLPSTLILWLFHDFFLHAFPEFPGSLQTWNKLALAKEKYTLFAKGLSSLGSGGICDLAFKNLIKAYKNLLFIVVFSSICSYHGKKNHTI